MANTYEQLKQEERDLIAVLKGQGLSLRAMAERLGRSPSTLSRELRRNAPPVHSGYYLAHKAQARAEERIARGRQRKRLKDPRLRAYARRRLKAGWSPERIAGRWKRMGRGRISHEAVYQWVYT